jgi:hypothetical protein
MDLPDTIGDVLTVHGHACRLISVVEVRRDGRQALYLASIALENADGTHQHGSVPLISNPSPGGNLPTILYPARVFDEAGGFVEVPRPLDGRIRDIQWTGANGDEYRVDGTGWPRPYRSLTPIDQIRKALSIAPSDDETERHVAGRLIRRLGVPLLDLDGRDRPPADIVADARARRDRLAREYHKREMIFGHYQALDQMADEYGKKAAMDQTGEKT